MPPLLTDLNHALRGLLKSPALAAVGVLSLALGLGANVTIYGIVREMVLDDISARQPDRLARLPADIPYSRYRELRDAGVFQDLAFDLWFTDVNWISGARPPTTCASAPTSPASRTSFFRASMKISPASAC